MNIATVKLEIVKLVMDTQNEGVLETVKELLESVDNIDYLDTLSDEEKLELGIGITQEELDEIPSFSSITKKLKS